MFLGRSDTSRTFAFLDSTVLSLEYSSLLAPLLGGGEVTYVYDLRIVSQSSGTFIPLTFSQM